MSAPTFTTRSGRGYTLEDIRRMVKSRGIGDESPHFEDFVQEAAIAVWSGRSLDHAIVDSWRKYGTQTRRGVVKQTENTLSLNHITATSDNVEIIDTIASNDTAIEDMDFDTDRSQELLNRLSAAERRMVIAFANGVPLKKIGSEHRLSESRVSQIIERARKRLTGELPPAQRSPLKKRVGPCGRENWDTPFLRQQEIKMLQHIANGLDRTQISAMEHYSTRMVDTYIESAIRRMGARSRTQAVAEAIRRGLID